MRRILLLSFSLSTLMFVFDPFSVVHGQSASIAVPGAGEIQPRARTSDYICTLSAFFSADAEQAYRPRALFEGRGLLTCRNDQGFTTELPVLVDLEAQLSRDSKATALEVTMSANTSAFVVGRELMQAQDAYLVRPGIQSVSDNKSTSVLLRGLRHDLVMDMKLNSQTIEVSGVRVTGLKLRIDDSAPDLF